jgi:hypothetical protein
MSKKALRLAAVVITLVLCAGLAWSADRVRDQKQDGTGDGPIQQQLKDGSCFPDGDGPAGQAVQTRAGEGAGEPKQAQNGPAAGTGDDEPDRTQNRAGEDNAQGDTDRDRDRDCQE